jgi:hypothetical protein
MEPSFDRSMLITLRVRAGTGAEPRLPAVVVAERHHLSGYPVTLEDRAAGDPSTVIDQVREWLAEFESHDVSPPS